MKPLLVVGVAGGNTEGGGEVRIAYIRWFDSSVYGEGAFDPSELTGYCENESAGLVVADDGDSITIAVDRCIDNEQIRLALCVPRVNVRSIQYFDPTVVVGGVV